MAHQHLSVTPTIKLRSAAKHQYFTKSDCLSDLLAWATRYLLVKLVLTFQLLTTRCDCQ